MEEFDYYDFESRWSSSSEEGLDEDRKKRIKTKLFRTLFPNNKVTPIRSGIKKPFHYSKVAILLLIAVPMAVAYLYFTPFSQKEVVYKTSGGETKKVILSDQTIVWLNGNSKFSIDGEFNHSTREVKLEGEAHFDVSHDSKHPFIVYSDGIATRVTGTKFNIRSYAFDSLKVVSVTEGKVLVARNYKGYGQPDEKSEVLEVTAGEQAELNANSKSLLKKRIENSEHLTSWRNKPITYQQTQLSQIAKELQQRYDVTIQFSDPDLKRTRITGVFDDESWQEIIEMICLSTDLDYKINGSLVIINKGGTSEKH